jgi:hypothetical protein
MSINKQLIIDEFRLKPFGQKGWMRSKDLVCPSCGQSDEFAVLFTDRGGIVHCLHSKSCNNYKTSLYNYLKQIGKGYLINEGKSVELDSFPSFKEEKDEDSVFAPLKPKRLPIGFKRIDFDEYLDGRGFNSEHYDLFGVGQTRIDPSIKSYLVFQFYDDEGQTIAWMARSKKPKEWHDNNLRDYKEGRSDLRLRYKNSPDTDFSRILGGEREIVTDTDTLILVEGLFDKINVDNELGLLDSDYIKCCFTFGNKVSNEQIDIINKYENIKNVYLLYDEGTIKQSKHCGILLGETGKNVNVCEIKQKNLDPGDMKSFQLLEALEKSVNFLMFNFAKIDAIV